MFPLLFLISPIFADPVIWKWGAHSPAELDPLTTGIQFINHVWSKAWGEEREDLLDLVQLDFQFLNCQDEILNRERFVDEVLLNLGDLNMRRYVNFSNAFVMSESYLQNFEATLPMYTGKQAIIPYWKHKLGLAYSVVKLDVIFKNMDITFVIASWELKFKFHAAYAHRCEKQEDEPPIMVQPLQTEPITTTQQPRAREHDTHALADPLNTVKGVLDKIWRRAEAKKRDKLVDLIEEDFSYITCQKYMVERDDFIDRVLLDLPSHGMENNKNITNVSIESKSLNDGRKYSIIKFDLIAKDKIITFEMSSGEGKFKLREGKAHDCPNRFVWVPKE